MPPKQKKNAQPQKPPSVLAKPKAKKEVAYQIPKWVVPAVLVITAIIYSRCLFNGFVGLDDDRYIRQDELIKNFSIDGIKTIFTSIYCNFYHPFTLLTFLIEYTFFKLNPLPYHLFNIILHLLNTWLVYKLVHELSGKKITALAVMILFALHPMHVESVVWVAERKDVLYSFFYLWSLLVYLRYLKSNFAKKYYVAALLIFVASLLSKPAAVTLPVLLIVFDLYKGRKINFKSLLEKIPFLLLSVGAGIITLFQTADILKELSLSYNIIEKTFLISYTFAFYIAKLFVPFNLSVMYYYPAMQNGMFPWQYYAALPFVLIAFWAILRPKKNRREVIFGLSFFLITILMMVQIFPNSTALVCERYTYISYIGLFYIAGQWISDIKKKETTNIVMVLFTFIMLAFCITSYIRIGTWKNGDTLFNDIVEKNPHYYRAYLDRGAYRSNNGEMQTGLQDMNYSITLDSTIAETFAKRGFLEYQLGDNEAAIFDNTRAIRLDPEMAEAYNNRGVAYYRLNKTDLALEDFNKTILINPKTERVFYNRGVLKSENGDLPGSLNDLTMDIKYAPGDGDAYGFRGYINFQLQNYKQTIEDINISLKQKPDIGMSYYYRGMSKLCLKDTTNACQDLKRALQLGYKDAADVLQKCCK